MDTGSIFDRKGFLKRDADPEKLQHSGSEDQLSEFDDSDDDPTMNP